MFEHQARILRGLLANEPFYRCRPASYWSRELRAGKRPDTSSFILLQITAARSSGIRAGANGIGRGADWKWWVIEHAWLARYLPRDPEQPPILGRDGRAGSAAGITP